ncbi:MAG: hypothetical protein M3Y18_09655 [Candidatus Eremiobacteraeota bacterium]|nr:hypothetical protein [Candidatus Eremiobacteraeota bacterium]
MFSFFALLAGLLHPHAVAAAAPKAPDFTVAALRRVPPSTAAVRRVALHPCAGTGTLPRLRRADRTALRVDFRSVVAGSANVYVYVDDDGEVVAADLEDATDETFGRAAIGSVGDFHFRPATCDGKAVPGRYIAAFNA